MLLVEITELNGRLDEMASLKASYFIKNKNGMIVKSGKFDKSITFEGKYDSYIEALSVLISDLSIEIAKKI